MLKVGLTGGIGSGKTAVSDIFHSLGIRVIDTDIIAHDILSKDQTAKQEIINNFGDSILADDNAIDRRKLAKVVFNDDDKKKQLEKILHPRIRRTVFQQIDLEQPQDNNGSDKYIIIVVPLLLETDFHELVDQILVVTADKDLRIQRIQQRDHRTANDIRSIMDQQIDETKRLSMADDIIENNGNIKNLASQVEILNKKYTVLAEAI